MAGPFSGLGHTGALDSGTSLLCLNLFMCFSGHSNPLVQPLLSYGVLSDPILLPLFQSAPAEKLGLPPSHELSGYWSLIRIVLRSAGLVDCGLNHRLSMSWFSAESLGLLDAFLSIPASKQK